MNPFKVLNDIYDDSIKEADKAGYSDLYKNTFLRLVDYLSKEYNLIIEDIEYLGGYFFFGSGTNSVIHFKFKGIKSWKFGLWWHVDQIENFNPVLKGEIFCQHERHLDKFKPTRSDYCQEITFMVTDGIIDDKEFQYNYELTLAGKMCKFVHDHPYLAWYKEWNGYDYNINKQKPILAFLSYYADGFSMWWKQTIHNLLDFFMLKKLNKYAHRHFDNTQYKWEINDFGEEWSPRYELLIEVPDNDAQETGSFRLFDTDKENHKWEQDKIKLEKIGIELGAGYWNCNVSNYVTFWNKTECDKERDKATSENLAKKDKE